MTFVEYARARRMGLALKQIREGHAVIDAQLSTGYESSSGFRDAFSRIMGAAPSRSGHHNILKASWIDTRLGPMMAIADEEALYLLEFVDRRGLEREVERLRQRTKSAIVPGYTAPIRSIELELGAYFDGKLTEFKTPLFLLGSPFQKKYGTSYCRFHPDKRLRMARSQQPWEGPPLIVPLPKRMAPTSSRLSFHATE